MSTAGGAGTPLPRRVRVVVLGNSTAMYVRPRRKDRRDRNYGELLEESLRQRGIDAFVVNEARWWDMVHRVLPRWEATVNAHVPDIVILNFGLGECQPNFFSSTVLRWVYTWRPTLNPVGSRFRSIVVRPLQRAMAASMPHLSRRVGMRTWRLPPKRFRSELTRLIEITRRETGALVLVLTPNPPGPFLQNLMPGVDDRAVIYGDLIRTVVADLADPEVQIVEAGAVVDKLGWRKTMLDGLHYTARGHQEVAALLEEPVLKWLDGPGQVG
ncbi:MAG TPA: SGNH/GDSL hydrolase family protein [Acidimicrobiales bacterium]|nr:SGNH/GDSL hydrolase family protein [Acidimicrobiales bacterium]